MSGEPTHPLVGQTLAGRYRIEDQLGEGGVGVVFRAEHLALGRIVAVKVLHKGAFAMPAAEARFEREARALAALSHPHIVTVTDFGRDGDVTYLAMEIVEGKSLREILDDTPRLPFERALDIIVQTLRALSYAHDKGVLHRDLKPANLMVRELQQGGPFVQILDFGMAKLVSGDAREKSDPALTRPGHVAGTPAYMAPELLDSQKASPASDLYAVGIVLFEMLAGQKPFDGETPLEILRGHLAAPIPRLSEMDVNGAFVPAAEQLIARFLAKDPALRFASAAEALEAIDALGATPETPGRRSKIAFEPTVPAAPAPPAQPAQPAPDAERASKDDRDLPRSSRAPATPARRRGSFGTAMVFFVVLLASFAAAALLVPRDLVLPYVARFFPGAGAGGAGTGAADGGVTTTPPDEADADAGGVTVVFGDEMLDGGVATSDAGLLAVTDASLPDAHFRLVIEVVDAGHDAGPAIEPVVEQPEVVTDTPTGAPPPADLLAEPLGRRLAQLARRARTASRPPHFTALYDYARENPNDPRVHLILAHAFVRLSWRGDAITRYEQAWRIDPRARGDRSMMTDLIALTADRTHGARAADVLAEVYGREARPAVERALAATSPDDADTRRRLTALLRRLR